MNAKPDPKQEPWQLERKIPLALIATVVGTISIQSIGIAWWASAANTRLDVVEKRVDTFAPQAERLVRLETKFDGLVAGVAEIKDLLRRPPPAR